MAGIVLGARDTPVNKAKILDLVEGQGECYGKKKKKSRVGDEGPGGLNKAGGARWRRQVQQRSGWAH